MTSAPSDFAAGLSQRLRSETRADHERVDAAYGRFDLADAAGYAAFLSAQARVLPALEALLRPAECLAAWRGRAEALGADLAALGIARPAPLRLALPGSEGARWGAIYVLEGSRLGGAMLARRIGAGLPCAFLGSVHPPGAWRNLLSALDGLDRDEHGAAIEGARAVFGAFTRAAAPGGGLA